MYIVCSSEGSYLSAFLLREGNLRAWAQGCSQTSWEHTSTGTSPCVNNSLFTLLLLLRFFPIVFPWEHGNIWNWGRSLKIHIETTKGVCLHPTNVHHMLLWSLSSSFLATSLNISWFELVIRSESHYFAHLLKLCKRKENRMLLM